MSESCILEIFTEEIPLSPQRKSCFFLAEKIEQLLKFNKISFSKIDKFYTVRRIIVIVYDIKTIRKKEITEKLSSTIGSPDDNARKDLDQNLSNLIKQAILAISWPKTMKWGHNKTYWIRPIKNLLLVNTHSTNVEIKIDHITSNNISYGHPRLNNNPFRVKNPDDFLTNLENTDIIFDQDIRKSILQESYKKIAHEKKLKTYELNDRILTEFADSTEYPRLLIGKINESFLNLPKEIILSCIIYEQKYLPLLNENNTLSPYFIVILDLKNDKNDSKIIHNYTLVLENKLKDALFFYQKDIKTPLIDLKENLKNKVFYNKLGSIYDKVERMVLLSKYVSKELDNIIDEELLTQTAKLCKIDLTTYSVNEFPELQGIIGKYLTLKEKYNPEISEAIAEHYRPLGNKDSCPESIYGAIVSIIDKIDTITGMFIIESDISSSKDPFGIRRNVISIVRNIIKHKLNINIHNLIKKSVYGYSPENKTNLFNKIIRGDNKDTKEQDKTISNISDFFCQKLENYIIKSYPGVTKKYIAATTLSPFSFVNIKLEHAVSLADFIQTESGSSFINSLKRLHNIIAKIKGIKDIDPRLLQRDLLESPEELDLFYKTQTLSKDLENSTQNYYEKLISLSELSEPIEKMIDNNKINHEKETLKINRINLLKRVITLTSDYFILEKIIK